MKDLSPTRFQKTLIGLGLLGLLTVMPIAWVILSNTDRELREQLLAQATVAAKAVNTAGIKKLSGTEMDLAAPEYIRLKEQLVSIRSASKKYRFFYLMGRRVDGTIFFFADSEPNTSTEYSPPGQVYRDATKDLRAVFIKKVGSVEGPVKDEWGVWISALSPVIDPQTNEVVAVLGADIDARLWKWDVANRVLPSLGFMVLTLICVVAFFYAGAQKSKYS